MSISNYLSTSFGQRLGARKPDRAARSVWLVRCLLAAVFAGCASAPAPLPRAKQPPEARAALVISEWAAGLSDPASLAHEDVRGQAALIYRALATVSPRAGSAVGAVTGGLIANALVCALPLLSYWSTAGCDPDPNILLPAGPVGQALAAAGVISVSDDGGFVEVPPERVFQGLQLLANERRQWLARMGAETCRFASIEAEWHPDPMPLDACEQSEAAPATGDAGTCIANLLLWNSWQDDVAQVWVARATCRGTSAVFAISAREEHDHRDAVLFVATGSTVDAALEHWRALR
jgi:hypothetical protein